ncbi:MAG: ATPase [Bacteroidetes bacterium]|nr:MAG: ATPase [Bacteroidota bacterium]
MNLIHRKIYLQRIAPFIGKDLIKVITGQRRVGKSYFLKQIMEDLKARNPIVVAVYINKEDFEFDFLNNHENLIHYVENYAKGEKKIVLFIDEIQEISNFEKALIHFHSKGIYDIYCSGSNARLLSGELATLLSGRSIEIKIYSLTYPEFLIFHQLDNNVGSFEKYIVYGGMPNLVHFDMEKEVVSDYLNNLFNTIIVRDVISRYSIRNVSFIRNLVLFLADNTGSIVSSKRISDYFKSQKIKISPSVIQDYLLYLSETFFIHQVKRSNLQGKKIFEFGEKYYFNDIGMRNALIGYKATDIGKILENIVYLHLKVAGYNITVGKDRDKEIDFIAEKNGELTYVQVCYLLEKQSTIDREFGNLKKIRNDYPKIVVSMDTSSTSSIDGIKHFHIRDFCVDL